MIFADYFQLKAKHYLVVGDRLSGWRKLFKLGWTQLHPVPKVCEHGERRGGSGEDNMGCGASALRMIITRIGVPEEISSDGGLSLLPRKLPIYMHGGASNTGCLLHTSHSQTAELRWQ